MFVRLGLMAVSLAVGLLVPVHESHAAAAHQMLEPARCTILGTPEADRLVGTSRADVICGGGGNDVLLAGGGTDILRGGPGDDVLLGETSPDVLHGGLGHDTLNGGSGTDVVFGDEGDDLAAGGSGDDHLLGGPGDDELKGKDSSADLIDGGIGANYCRFDDSDTLRNCTLDTQQPTPLEVTFTPATVDVTDADAMVTFRVHATDDTGVAFVRITPAIDDQFPTGYAKLESGDFRDGWWKGTLTIRQGTVPGTYVPRLDVYDRVDDRSNTVLEDDTLEVTDSNPDTELPTVNLLSPATGKSFDISPGAAVVRLTAHVTDAMTGVGDVMGCLEAPRSGGVPTYFPHCLPLERVSGDQYDGVWTRKITLIKGVAPLGDWTVNISASDVAHLDTGRRVSYWGPGEYDYRMPHSELNLPFPDNGGWISVTEP